MQPYREGADVDAAWAPIWNGQRPEQGDEVQLVANVLQVRAADGRYVNRAPERGLAATGWTWSVQFGDLDHDGLLDVYAVNGMIGTVFEHLPAAELVEENQALRNTGAGGFVPVPEWGLGATEGGRGMAMADLDLDGDLDLVVNNVAAPAILCRSVAAGRHRERAARWPISTWTAISAGREPGVRRHRRRARRQRRGGPALARLPQPARDRRPPAARHPVRLLPARGARGQRLPVERAGPSPLRSPRRSRTAHAHRNLARRRHLHRHRHHARPPGDHRAPHLTTPRRGT